MCQLTFNFSSVRFPLVRSTFMPAYFSTDGSLIVSATGLSGLWSVYHDFDLLEAYKSLISDCQDVSRLNSYVQGFGDLLTNLQSNLKSMKFWEV